MVFGLFVYECVCVGLFKLYMWVLCASSPLSGEVRARDLLHARRTGGSACALSALARPIRKSSHVLELVICGISVWGGAVHSFRSLFLYLSLSPLLPLHSAGSVMVVPRCNCERRAQSRSPRLCPDLCVWAPPFCCCCCCVTYTGCSLQGLRKCS